MQGLAESNVIKEFDDNKSAFVKGFSFSGNAQISSDELQDIIKDYANKELAFKQVKEALALINQHYRSKGYFVARAYLAPQDLTKNDNILVISILEGHYGEFRLKNSSLVQDKTLQGVLDSVKDRDIISASTIQRATNLVNDRAGAVVTKATISAGEKTGTSDFDIEVEETKRVDGYIVADNYGSRYTGYNRLQGLININSPFDIGDKLSISGLVSNGADLKNARIAYELPLTADGLTADVAYTRTNYNLVKEYRDLNIKGDQSVYEVGLSYPIIRTTNENLYLKGKYYHKDMNDYMDGDKFDDRKIDSFVASVDYDKNYYIGDLPARIFANLNLTTGHLGSKNDNPNNGNYNKVDAYVSNNIYFNDIVSFNSTLMAQKVLGDKNLDGSEDLALGGPNGVKLYPYSEQTGENGYIASFELFTKLPNIASYAHRVGLFYDIGDVYQERNLDATFKRTRLKDVGVGYYSSYDSFFLRAQMAWAANSKPIESENASHKNSKFLLQAGWVF